VGHDLQKKGSIETVVCKEKKERKKHLKRRTKEQGGKSPEGEKNALHLVRCALCEGKIAYGRKRLIRNQSLGEGGKNNPEEAELFRPKGKKGHGRGEGKKRMENLLKEEGTSLEHCPLPGRRRKGRCWKRPGL